MVSATGFPDHPAPPVKPIVAAFFCIEPRLADSRARSIKEAGGGFTICMAGAAAALLVTEDRPAALRQITLAWTVHPFERFLMRVHRYCGYLRIYCAPGGELERFDPDNLLDCFTMADMAGEVARAHLLNTVGADRPSDSEVIDIDEQDGQPVGLWVPRPPA